VVGKAACVEGRALIAALTNDAEFAALRQAGNPHIVTLEAASDKDVAGAATVGHLAQALAGEHGSTGALGERAGLEVRLVVVALGSDDHGGGSVTAHFAIVVTAFLTVCVVHSGGNHADGGNPHNEASEIFVTRLCRGRGEACDGEGSGQNRSDKGAVHGDDPFA